jgi:hypothetical protein
VVECNLAKVEVAGSNPVSRSIQSTLLRPLQEFNVVQGLTLCNGRHSQVVRQRSAKPLFTSSNLVAASIPSFIYVTLFYREVLLITAKGDAG